VQLTVTIHTAPRSLHKLKRPTLPNHIISTSDLYTYLLLFMARNKILIFNLLRNIYHISVQLIYKYML